ncbi:hypothetical protein EII17_01690 [Clostridiales bacterium COT073_COT-073]|nr:hypothetical protein EII17_01690 [Clostridiales bacterium COT073_COT-073]
MKYPMEVTINIRPVFSNMVHTDAWEGPCRVGTAEELEPSYEIRSGREQFKLWAAMIEENLKDACHVLPAIYIEYDESFVVRDSELDKLREQITETDVFLISYRIPGIEALGVPVTMINRGPTPIDLVAFYRTNGLAAYFAHDFDEYKQLLHLLWVKKAIAHTKILILSSANEFPVSVNTSNPDAYGLFIKYGIRNTRLPFREVFAEMAKMNCQAEADKMAAELIAGAVANYDKAEWIAQDIKYYLAVRQLMERFDCNAFTTPCKELCASQLPAQNKCTPCLTHSLLKDQGLPSACEEDMNVWMAIMVLMYTGKRSVHMGNPMLILKDQNLINDIGMSRIVYGPESFSEEMLEIRHSVPGIKMQGFSQPAMPYELGSFTHEGWGTKIQVNMGENTDTRRVTIGRFDRSGTKMIVAGGEVVGCAFKDDECSPAVYLKIDGGAREFRHALADGGFGHHLAMVYGDFSKQIQALGKIMGFTVVVHK